MNKKYYIITCIATILSIISGILSNDLLIGGSTLLTGLLCAYFASEGKRINYILALINYILMAYVSLKNNLYGLFFFYIFIFSPLQIHGFFSWKKHLNKNKNVKIRQFNVKNSILIIFSCFISSFILGYLLTLIPNQQLAFLDSSSNCINLCGVILMIFRFKECWLVWLANNIIDLTIWSITFFYNGSHSIMILLTSIGFLLINIYGIFKWNFQLKKEHL